jgi:Methyltransferase domain
VARNRVETPLARRQGRGLTDFDAWIEALTARHQADLTFAEISRSLRALSSTYVERRHKLQEGAALAGAGKRAAFALFYGPLHFLLIREIVRALPGAADGARTLVDLGCGTGASGAAWASECRTRPEIIGIDRHPWALEEAARAYRQFHLRARTRQGDAATVPMPKPPALVLAAFTVNELSDAARTPMLPRLLERASKGDRLLIVEPIAGGVAPWWNEWREAFERAGGRGDEWRVRVELPPIVQKLDRAAGLNHRELRGRSLWLAGART